MSVLKRIMKELDEIYIIENVTKCHDEARMKYRLDSITVSDDHEFNRVIGEYYNYHYSQCFSSGGKLSLDDASEEAKEIIFRTYQQRRMDKLHAYSDGKQGTNGGMREILDIIMDSLKEKAVQSHIRSVLDRYIQPSSFEEQMEIIKELIDKIEGMPTYIDPKHPERYARDYEDLIRGLVESKRIIFSKLRRM